MKINKILVIAFFLTALPSMAKDNLIVLTPTSDGSEGMKCYNDESEFIIDEKNNKVLYNSDSSADDWTILSSKLSFKQAKGKTFSLLFGAGKKFNNKDDDNFGALEIEAGIDRAQKGQLGVAGGLGNGIDTNEGYRFGLNLSNLPASITVQISKIEVVMLHHTETGMIVNRGKNSKKLNFGVGNERNVNLILPNGGGWIDLSPLEITLKGGSVNADMMTIFSTIGDKTTPNNQIPNFRINSIELKLSDK